jgi:Acetyltransferase (GNAT) domain
MNTMLQSAKRAAAGATAVAAGYSSAALLPSWPAAASPFGTREWAAAWELVSTESVLTASHLEVAAGDACRVASFYLTIGSPAWRAYEMAAGVAPVWGDPVVYGPSPYALYGGFGLDGGAAIGAVVDHGLALARRAGACAVVFPGLRAEQARAWLGVRGGGVACRTLDAHRAPVRGSVEAFQQAIAARRARKEFGRQWRRGDDCGLRLRVLPGEQATPELPAFATLASAAAAKHDVPGMYGVDILRAGLLVPGSVLLAAEHDGRLVGGFLCFRHDRTFYLWSAGLDYAALPALHTYGWLLAEAVRYAAETGAVTLDAGRGNHHYKQRIGLSPVPLYALAYLTRPNAALKTRLAQFDRRMTVLNDLDGAV